MYSHHVQVAGEVGALGLASPLQPRAQTLARHRATPLYSHHESTSGYMWIRCKHWFESAITRKHKGTRLASIICKCCRVSIALRLPMGSFSGVVGSQSCERSTGK